MQNSDDPIIVVSDTQDMNQTTGKMTAEGNVRVYYQDMMGAGPKILLLRNANGRAEKVIFTERSQVSQPGKRWIADQITMAVATKRIIAEGNTKAFITGGPGKPKGQPSNSALAMRPGTNDSKNSTSDENSKKSTVAGSNKGGIYEMTSTINIQPNRLIYSASQSAVNEDMLYVDNLQKSYHGRRVVDNVSFTVARGEVVGLLGRNGAGKTTSFDMVLGLVKPEKGRYKIWHT